MQRIGVILEDMETGTAGDDTGTHLGKAFKNLLFGLVDLVCRHIDPEFLRHARIQPQHPCGRHGRNHAHKVRQPALLLPFEFLDGAGAEVELLLEGPQQLLVAVTGAQFSGKDAADGMTAGSNLAAYRQDKWFFSVHNIMHYRTKIRNF